MVDKANRSNPTVPPEMQTEFDALVRLSAKVGQDPLLVQAAGGNTSLKIGDVMWIKASGTNLGDALERNIFVPTAWRDIARSLKDGSPEADQPATFLLGDGGLRPSIETCLHAVFDAAVVVHVHCVSTIALAVLLDGERRIKEHLSGIEWVWVPYRRPGAELGRMLIEKRTKQNVAVLGNHGLLVAADSVADAETLLEEICYKLELVANSGAEIPPAPAPDGYTPLKRDHVLSRAMAVSRLRETALHGNMYPDHIIFCGPTIGRAEKPSGEILIIDHEGRVSIRTDANAGAEALAGCLGNVLLRLPEDSQVSYLTIENVASLLNWDAEIYRQSLNG
ncbi:class II aldolase/adducin family protein [Brucella rhizosphaerae]|uniref:class II aldolase/adducin family protein n=1 Tax=Brucella rhizosphaerae TaxID=571254 RepID=UPI000B993EF9|nr:class II aldolase/adducin family protein [Brucella rhizosphaerae]